jgi:hypothetical protein
MRLADHSVSLKALPVNALIGLEQTTRFTGGHDSYQLHKKGGCKFKLCLKKLLKIFLGKES